MEKMKMEEMKVEQMKVERAKIREQVVKQLSALISNDMEITEETYLCEDLDIGSMEVYELIAELEDVYGISILSDLSKSFVQVKDIVDFLDEKINENKDGKASE